MAIWYYPSGTDSTTSGAWSGQSAYCVMTTTATNASTVSTNWGWSPYPRVVTKRVYAKAPAHWNRSILRAFAKLINEETNTGWKVEALISGDIEIYDPYADIRDMKDCVGLLKARASIEDCKKINAFFKKVGLEAKPKRRAKPKRSPARKAT